MYDVSQHASDEALLNRLVFVGDKQTPLHGLNENLKGVFTLHELLCKIGIYPFLEWFVDGRTEWFWFDDEGESRILKLELIDCDSHKRVCAEGVVRAANRFYGLNLWRYRDKLKPRSGSKEETKWVRRYRGPKRMAILACAAGRRDREEFEPPIRKRYVQELKYAYALMRFSNQDRSWKRFRSHQHKDKKGR